MKKIQAKKVVHGQLITPEELDNLFNENKIEWNKIDEINWKEYPYCPSVDFRIGYTDGAILLEYKVREQTVLAHCGSDNGDIWTDSCVEFFIQPDGSDMYYNIECNCIGSLLIGCGHDRSDRQRGDVPISSQIKRWASLGNKTFSERKFDEEWKVCMIIPLTAFFKSNVSSIAGKTIKANFYKCGDNLTVPHFLSWSPIHTSEPNFHQPAFFGQIEFK